MSQVLSLTTPVVPAPLPSTTNYRIIRFVIEREPFARIMVAVASDAGDRIQAVYTDEMGGTVAAGLISALNTANLSTISLQARILNRLAADGKLPAGNVTGVPD